ncbi:methyl-accepting chemotaxis protein [Desulforegula conservatrix]|uniref:methyl-accepting chemotaxis protein n=1 Tax=Desulforegula conservatrix TaxID=153026 RepID=UPI00041A5ADA|nr:methyl-accepting chemotaxis protein [Desulforegula conservatrix]
MKITLRNKVLGLITVSVVMTALIVTAISAVDTIRKGIERADSYKETLLSERETQIKGYVEIAANLISTLPEDEAKKAIEVMRYGDKGYLWIHDYNNVMIYHPDPALNGKDLSNLKDPKGLNIIGELTKICREKGEGFLKHSWKIPGQEIMRPKITFAKAIPRYSWIVSTGLYVDDIDEAVASRKARINKDVISTIILELCITLAVALFFMSGTAYLLNRFISRPISAMTRAMKAFDNDLRISVPVTSNDEIGELAAWFNELIDKLHHSIIMVSEVTNALNVDAGTISSNMHHQSSFAAQLASSVAEITSSMEELSSSASQIAQHSQSVVSRADQTLADTRNGASEVEHLTEKIDLINQGMQSNLAEIVSLGRKSKEITKVMEIINNIANQTKLIAFNAALEAASAGEVGKRFGVVAVEIRRLADSVVASTMEIEGKITEILDSVNRLVMSSEKTSVMMREGQESSKQTVSMLMNMVNGVEEATDSARQISLSTQQQQIASSQVLIAIKDIDQGVRHSTTSARESSIVAGELAKMAGRLKTLVNTFKIDESRQSSHSQQEKE